MNTTTVPRWATLSQESLRILPEHMRELARLYVEEGRPDPDGFVAAVASNDLRQSFGIADDINRSRMFDWVRFFTAYVPSAAWGSRQAVHEWIKQGGLRGVASRDAARKEQP